MGWTKWWMLGALLLAGCPGGEGTADGECADADDNDGDGLVDCNDPGCAEDPACVLGDDDAGDDDAGDDDAGDDDAGDDDAGDDHPGDDDTSAPDADGDGVEDSLDCAPNDPTIYPGAIDTCDGVDNDCNNDGDAADTAYWVPTTGAPMDITPSLSGGTAAAPALFTFPGDGALTLCPGTFHATFTVPSGASVTVTGADRTTTTIDTLTGGRAFDVETTGSLTLSHVTLSGGSTTDSQQPDTVRVGHNGSLTLSHARVVDCVSIYNWASAAAVTSSGNAATFVVDDVLFDGNHSHLAVAGGGSLTVSNSTFTNGVNGMLGMSGVVSVTDSTFSNNGGMFEFASNTTLTMSDCTISDTGDLSAPAGTLFVGGGAFDYTLSDVTITNTGGAVFGFYDNSVAGTLTLTDVSSSVSSTTATGAVGYWANPGTLTATRLTSDGGTTTAWGGGWNLNDAGATVSFTDSMFSNNSAGNAGGGGLYISSVGTLSLTGSSFVDNSAVGQGGGLLVANHDLLIDGVTFSGNTSTQTGGAAYFGPNAGPPTTVGISNSTFTGNSSDGSGGAVYADWSTVSFGNTTFTNNTSGGEGGAVYLRRASALTDCDFTGNTATGNGGGLYPNGLFGTTVLTGGSFSGNSAALGGGIYSYVGFNVSGVDFGDGADENSPDDIGNGIFSEDHDGDTTLVCTGSSCS